MSLRTQTLVVPAPRDPVRRLAAWAAECCPDGGQVLEVGAGEHVSGALGPLLQRRPVLVGTDPDEAIERNTALAERHRLLLEDFAPRNACRFDLVISVFVLEHVEHPREFAAACATVLRPGGSWFALTLNVNHYFGATARAAHWLGAEAPLLRLLKGAGAQHDHRFPTRYRLNSRRAVARACSGTAFDSVEFRCYDAPDRYAWYLPAPLDRLPPVYSRLAYRVGWSPLMGHLSFRSHKADGR
jgi:SAM-dependent methyltransferase